MTRPRLYAHRGASIELPENSIPAFRRALELGANALETDIHLTRDGVIVAAHDDDGVRMAGVSRKIIDTTWAEIQRWNIGVGFVEANGQRPYLDQPLRMPTLEQLLTDFPDVVINLDMKTFHKALPEKLLALLRKMDACDRVQVGSFHNSLVWYLRYLKFPGVTSLTSSEVLGLLSAPRQLLRRFPARRVRAQIFTELSRLQLATKRTVERCAELGVPIDVFTVNDPHAALHYASLGVDGVMTDDPATIVAAFDQRWPDAG